ncbi:hypothetical protein Zmor_006751 [Zophobas morio]|uniref:Uncharacterized protein n=1 Tax=Zophobas morio TaxID=2755281 RepID=A0AA38ISD5_9CUCU|nr:hypothetical protein Zmor_006751 [Zophobas morio]
MHGSEVNTEFDVKDGWGHNICGVTYILTNNILLVASVVPYYGISMYKIYVIAQIMTKGNQGGDYYMDAIKASWFLSCLGT